MKNICRVESVSAFSTSFLVVDCYGILTLYGYKTQIESVVEMFTWVRDKDQDPLFPIVPSPSEYIPLVIM